MAITSLLIANRGEIAVRIIRAARELGIRTIQAHSAADAESLAVKMADEAIDIGPPHAANPISTYRRSSMRRSGPAPTRSIRAMASSPRMPAFADAVEGAGLIFVGPTADAIRTHGRQGGGARAAAAAGVPAVPGSDGRVEFAFTRRATSSSAPAFPS